MADDIWDREAVSLWSIIYNAKKLILWVLVEVEVAERVTEEHTQAIYWEVALSF